MADFTTRLDGEQTPMKASKQTSDGSSLTISMGHISFVLAGLSFSITGVNSNRSDDLEDDE